METAVDVLCVAAGFTIVIMVLISAIRTVVVPRAESVMLMRIVFGVTLVLFNLGVRRASTFEQRDRFMARYAPVSLMILPLVWALFVMYGFSLIFWAFDVEPYRAALVHSGSSITTLGFASTSDLPTALISILEAFIGLTLIALLISFLPTMYGLFNQRESTVSKLYTRAADSEGGYTPTSLISRSHTVDALDQLSELWSEWEDWFVRLEEAHTSFPALNFFRSPRADRSWTTAAGLALDSAAIYISTVEAPRNPRESLMLRSGYVALRAIADHFGIEHDANPKPDDAISVSQDEYNEVYDALAKAGVPLREDRELAWRDFAGWRVNYDTVLLELCQLTMAPQATWSSDRTGMRMPSARIVSWRSRRSRR
ncbi:MAG: hypothetical protein IH940_06880 [Acidobacteria bacterium]|nr:hypothetical protein [Acidobacteriota bacterium]